jgi:hypothetical protein
VPVGFDLPTSLATDQFHLEPLGPQHNQADHSRDPSDWRRVAAKCQASAGTRLSSITRHTTAAAELTSLVSRRGLPAAQPPGSRPAGGHLRRAVLGRSRAALPDERPHPTGSTTLRVPALRSPDRPRLAEQVGSYEGQVRAVRRQIDPVAQCCCATTPASSSATATPPPAERVLSGAEPM